MNNPDFLESISKNLHQKTTQNIQSKSNNQDSQLQTRIPYILKTTAENSKAKQISCNCKNSQCIKLYCECFRNQTFCKNCNCDCCFNKVENPTRNSVINQIKQKNPNAFEPKYKPNKNKVGTIGFDANGKTVTGGDLLVDISRGCNCKNSNCQKKYCECFQNGLECSVKCKCVSCQNGNHLKNIHKQQNSEEFNNVSETEKILMRDKLLEKLAFIKRVKFSR